ncbi:MAG TPA: phosphopantetheine-binding protein [Mycobacteriales bacterium]|nr:phosphopantetheine-binding protein [Mycobacteriales bacterium]
MAGQRPSEVEITVDKVVEDLRVFFSQALTGNVPGPDEDYFAQGLVNSLLALELVAHVEWRFGVSVEVEDLDLDNFRTMNRIAEFVRKKRSVPLP